MSINVKMIRTKVGLLNLAEELGKCIEGLSDDGSDDTFYRHKNAMEEGVLEARMERNCRRIIPAG